MRKWKWNRRKVGAGTMLCELSQAKSNGMTDSGCDALELLIGHHRNVMHVRYNGGSPALVRPLKLHLTQGARPIHAKPRRYPPKKRQFPRNYVANLQKLGLTIIARRTDWKSAPSVFPEKQPSMYFITIYYRPINQATAQNTWLMPHINTVIDDVCVAKAFATV